MNNLEQLVKQLVETVLRRYRKIGIKLSPAEVENVYYSLLGTAERNGFDAARKEAENARLSKANKKPCVDNGIHFPAIEHVEEG